MGVIMKKFREFLNEKTECTKGDIIGMVVWISRERALKGSLLFQNYILWGIL